MVGTAAHGKAANVSVCPGVVCMRRQECGWRQASDTQAVFNPRASTHLPSNYVLGQISAQYLAQGKGTGVLVEYAGYSCIVAGTHLLPSPVAASKALVHFVLPEVPHPVTVST